MAYESCRGVVLCFRLVFSCRSLQATVRAPAVLACRPRHKRTPTDAVPAPPAPTLTWWRKQCCQPWHPLSRERRQRRPLPPECVPSIIATLSRTNIYITQTNDISSLLNVFCIATHGPLRGCVTDAPLRPCRTVFNNKVQWHQHQADVLRMHALRRWGGV